MACFVEYSISFFVARMINAIVELPSNSPNSATAVENFIKVSFLARFASTMHVTRKQVR